MGHPYGCCGCLSNGSLAAIDFLASYYIDAAFEHLAFLTTIFPSFKTVRLCILLPNFWSLRKRGDGFSSKPNYVILFRDTQLQVVTKREEETSSDCQDEMMS